MQRIYDKLETEKRQEDALDMKLLSDNARLMQRLKGR